VRSRPGEAFQPCWCQKIGNSSGNITSESTEILGLFSVSYGRTASLASPTGSGPLELPRFRGELRAWDQTSCWGVILSSSCVTFFGSTPGGAILPSRHARWCGRRAQRRSRTAPSWGRPKGVSLTVASTAAGWSASGSTFRFDAGTHSRSVRDIRSRNGGAVYYRSLR
jgi:hypothetical protein